MREKRRRVFIRILSYRKKKWGGGCNLRRWKRKVKRMKVMINKESYIKEKVNER
jgi:hypothetical protein